jgi:NADPH:quinone reductase-like Zn-dependent oxidoreductase
VDQKNALTELAAVVREGGHVATLLGAADIDQLAIRGVIGHNVNAAPTADKLRLLGELADSGALRVPIQGVYSIDQAGDALRAFQQGTRGKLVLGLRPGRRANPVNVAGTLIRLDPGLLLEAYGYAGGRLRDG